MTWLEDAACGGEDQADNVVPPRDAEKWNMLDAAVVAAALTRCAACLVIAPCLTEALTDRRDGANGGIYSHHGTKGAARRWVLRAGKLHRLAARDDRVS